MTLLEMKLKELKSMMPKPAFSMGLITTRDALRRIDECLEIAGCLACGGSGLRRLDLQRVACDDHPDPGEQEEN